MKNLIKITEKEFDVILDIRYASKNNVCQQKLYSKPACYLHKDLIEPLKKAISLAKNLGFKLKIWDCFRPLEVQKFMYDQFPNSEGGEGFVSNPENGAVPHCRGVAIDLTLTDLDGNEIEMGTDFDEFSSLAFHDCQEVSKTAQDNRIILLEIMSAVGLDFYSKEWWHYQAFNPREFEIENADEDIIAI